MMEWDLDKIISALDITSYKIAAYRDKDTCSFSLWLAVEVNLVDFWTVLLHLLPMDLTIHILTGKYLAFPPDYTWKPL